MTNNGKTRGDTCRHVVQILHERKLLNMPAFGEVELLFLQHLNKQDKDKDLSDIISEVKNGHTIGMLPMFELYRMYPDYWDRFLIYLENECTV